MNIKINLSFNDLAAIKIYLLTNLANEENKNIAKSDIINIRSFYIAIEKKILSLFLKDRKKKYSFSIDINQFSALERFYSINCNNKTNDLILYENFIFYEFINELRRKYLSLNTFYN